MSEHVSKRRRYAIEPLCYCSVTRGGIRITTPACREWNDFVERANTPKPFDMAELRRQMLGIKGESK